MKLILDLINLYNSLLGIQQNTLEFMSWSVKCNSQKIMLRKFAEGKS